MKCKRNWFYSFGTVLSGFLLLYTFLCCFMTGIPEGSEPYFYRGVLLAGLLAGLSAARLLAGLAARLRPARIFSSGKKWVFAAEFIFVASVIFAAVFLRLNLIEEGAHVLNEDETFYYEAAGLMAQGNLRIQGGTYCDMLAAAPYRMGYVWLLKAAFQIWGVRIEAGQYLNLFFAAAGLFFLYYTGRKLSGRTGGIAALLLGAFWPGTVSGVLVLTEESAFVFFSFGCGALLAHLLTDYDKDHGRAGVCFAGCILLGMFLAIGAMVSPLMLFFLTAVMIVAALQKLELPNKPLNDIPLLLRFIHCGWVRCLLIVFPFWLLYGILFTNIEMAIDRDAAWFGGYFALSDYSGGIEPIIAALAGKFEGIWTGTGISAGLLAPVVFAGLLGIAFLRQGGGNFLYIYVFWFLGMTGMNLMSRNETFLLSPVLYILFLFAGHGMAGIFAEALSGRAQLLEIREQQMKQEEENREELERYRKAEEEVLKIREEALANVFDMQYALEHGHVIMTVSEAYKEEKQEQKAAGKGDRSEAQNSEDSDSWEQIEKERTAFYGGPGDWNE